MTRGTVPIDVSFQGEPELDALDLLARHLKKRLDREPPRPDLKLITPAADEPRRPLRQK